MEVAILPTRRGVFWAGNTIHKESGEPRVCLGHDHVKMPPDPTCFAKLNLPPTFALPSNMEYFTLCAAPDTGLSRKPPAEDTATAPMVYTSLRHPFILAEVTVSAEWEREWDQGGLVIFTGLPPSGRSSEVTRSRHHDRSRQQRYVPSSLRWVKAGLEFTEGSLCATSTVANGCSADLAVVPLYPQCSPLPSYPLSNTSLRIKFERIGYSLWVWYQQPPNFRHDYSCRAVDPASPAGVAGTWRKLREVAGFFWEANDKEIHIGVYASRPATFEPMVGGNASWSGEAGSAAANALVVEFEDLEIF